MTHNAFAKLLTLAITVVSVQPSLCQIPATGTDAATTRISKTPGRLMMIGGGLMANNHAVFTKLIEYGGGLGNARFVIIPAASTSISSGDSFRSELMLHGVPADRIDVLNILEHNSASATNDEANLEKVKQATVVYMTGGDQRRLVRVLTKRDGSDTAFLTEIRKLCARGGLIAGTSAGASAQSKLMLAASGLPDMLVDEGLDALDYGLTSDPNKRGLLITQGLGFHDTGMVDQHFLQYRGRLGRLSRACADCQIQFGFGVDKNSAMVVEPDGKVLVVSGSVVIVETQGARGQDGPFGYAIQGLHVSLLSNGDLFDPDTRQVTVATNKRLLAAEDVAFNGNFVIGDIGSGYAITSALISGLAENHRSIQEGVVLQHHGETSHGYRYVFRKRPTTTAYYASTIDGSLYSLLDVQLDITPIANGVKQSSTQAPQDLGNGFLNALDQSAVASVAFRGLMPANELREFRPSDSISRAEFAIACVRSVHLIAPPRDAVSASDVELQSHEGYEITQAVAAGFVSLDHQHRFNPGRPLLRADAVKGLEKLVKQIHSPVPQEISKSLEQFTRDQSTTIPRSEIALLLHQILDLPN